MMKYVILDSGDIRSFKIKHLFERKWLRLFSVMMTWRFWTSTFGSLIQGFWLFRCDNLYPYDSLVWGYDYIQWALIAGSLASLTSLPPRRARGLALSRASRGILFAVISSMRCPLFLVTNSTLAAATSISGVTTCRREVCLWYHRST